MAFLCPPSRSLSHYSTLFIPTALSCTLFALGSLQLKTEMEMGNGRDEAHWLATARQAKEKANL